MIDRFERFSLAMFEIYRCWHKVAAEEMECYGLKGGHAVYLVAMARGDEAVTAAKLAEICGRDKADVSRAVRLMEEKGLLMREGANNNAYRARLILTEAGTKAAHHVQSRAALAVGLAGNGFSASERENFYAVLKIITDNLRRISDEGLPDEKEYLH